MPTKKRDALSNQETETVVSWKELPQVFREPATPNRRLSVSFRLTSVVASALILVTAVKPHDERGGAIGGGWICVVYIFRTWARERHRASAPRFLG